MNLSNELEKYRCQINGWTSQPNATFGLFYIPYKSFELKVLACDGKETGWDHVSVSLPNRCPNWEEMSLVKDLFFSEEETVFQFHPKKSEYVNNCETCLHLWKPLNIDIPLPDSILVGFK